MASYELNVENSKLNNNGENKTLKYTIRQKIINKIQDNGYDVEVIGKKLTIKRNGDNIGTIEEVPKRKSRLVEPMYGNPYMVNAGPGLDLKFIFGDMNKRMAVEELVTEVLENYNDFNNDNVEMVPVGGRRKRARKTKKRRHTTKPKRRSHTLRRKY